MQTDRPCAGCWWEKGPASRAETARCKSGRSGQETAFLVQIPARGWDVGVNRLSTWMVFSCGRRSSLVSLAMSWLMPSASQMLAPNKFLLVNSE
eukprot:1997821-Rhodomonas_salina.1